MNGKSTKCFHLFCVWLDFLLLVIVLASFICSLLLVLNCEYNCSQITPSHLAVYSLILGYAVHIFCTTVTKYVMFHVNSRRWLKCSMTSGLSLFCLRITPNCASQFITSGSHYEWGRGISPDLQVLKFVVKGKSGLATNVATFCVFSFKRVVHNV